MHNDDKQFKSLFEPAKHVDHNQPDREWLESTRIALQKHVAANPRKSNSTHSKSEKFSFGWLTWFPKPAVVTAMILILVFGVGGGSVYAAQDANPGDTLYPVKIVGEGITVFLAVSADAKAKLYLKYSDRRLQELEHLYEKDPDNTYWQEKVVENMNQHLTKTQSVLAEVEASEDTYEYTTLALEFEAVVQNQNDRLTQFKLQASDTNHVFERVKILNETSHQQAIKAIEKAQEKIEAQEISVLDRNDDIAARLQTRIDLIQARQAAMQARVQERLETAHDLFEAKQQNMQQFNTATATPLENRVYEETAEIDGSEFESRIEVESNGSEEVNTNIDLNNGQVIIDSTIVATGTTIMINDTTTIRASSSQRIRLNGEDIE